MFKIYNWIVDIPVKMRFTVSAFAVSAFKSTIQSTFYLIREIQKKICKFRSLMSMPEVAMESQRKKKTLLNHIRMKP